MQRVDVNVSGGGTIYLLQLLTPEARQWVEEKVHEEQFFFGNALAVETRYVEDLLVGMQADGLAIDVEAL